MSNLIQRVWDDERWEGVGKDYFNDFYNDGAWTEETVVFSGTRIVVTEEKIHFGFLATYVAHRSDDGPNKFTVFAALGLYTIPNGALNEIDISVRERSRMLGQGWPIEAHIKFAADVEAKMGDHAYWHDSAHGDFYKFCHNWCLSNAEFIYYEINND